jgi:hypothetical protein
MTGVRVLVLGAEQGVARSLAGCYIRPAPEISRTRSRVLGLAWKIHEELAGADQAVEIV